MAQIQRICCANSAFSVSVFKESVTVVRDSVSFKVAAALTHCRSTSALKRTSALEYLSFCLASTVWSSMSTVASV